MDELWEEVWRALREALMNQPRCSDHPEYPCIRTLRQGVINDIVEVGPDGIVVRSHLTGHDDLIEEDRFRTWWDHLQREGTACLTPDGAGNPHPWRSRIVGAILARCLPHRIRWDQAGSGMLQLIGPRVSDARPA